MQVGLNFLAEEVSFVFKNYPDILGELVGSMRIQPCNPRGGIDMITSNWLLAMRLQNKALGSQVKIPLRLDVRGLEPAPQAYKMSLLVKGITTTNDFWKFLAENIKSMREFFNDNVWEMICEDGFVLIAVSGPSDLALSRLSVLLGEVYSNAKFEL